MSSPVVQAFRQSLAKLAGNQSARPSRKPALPLTAVSLLLALTLAQPLLASDAYAAETASAAVSSLTASNPASALAPEDQFLRLVADFQRAGQGDDSGVEALAQALRQLATAHPSDIAVQAYAGSAVTMMARASWLPWRKIQYAEDGLAMLDKALARLDASHNAPGHRGNPPALEVKLTAANTFLALPSMFKRKERGLKLLAEIQASPLLRSSPAAFQAAVAALQSKQAEH